MPVSFSLLPAALHDLTPIHELTYELGPNAWVYGDKTYNSQADEQIMLEDTWVTLIRLIFLRY